MHFSRRRLLIAAAVAATLGACAHPHRQELPPAKNPGKLEPSQVEETLHGYREEFAACQGKRSDHEPFAIQGKVVVSFRVGTAGDVLEPRVQNSEWKPEPGTPPQPKKTVIRSLHSPKSAKQKTPRTTPASPYSRQADIERCVIETLKTVRFPKPRGGYTEVTYPFEFKSLDPVH